MIFLPDSISAGDFFHRFTLIIGEVNTGKTTFTQNILEALSSMEKGRFAVVDLAPHIVPAHQKKGKAGIGGTLKAPEDQRVNYHHCPVHAPRLQGKSESETLRLAEENARLIEVFFDQALEEKVDTLFVNDCSLYLQAGQSENLIRWVDSVETAVVNGYYGESLGTDTLSTRERAGMDDLIKHCDHLIQLKEQFDK